MSAGTTVVDDRVHVNSVTSPKTRSTLMAMPLRDRTSWNASHRPQTTMTRVFVRADNGLAGAWA